MYYNKRLSKPKRAIKSGQSRDTGNIWHTRHKTKTNKIQKHSTTQKVKKDKQQGPHQKQVWTQVLAMGKQLLPLKKTSAMLQEEFEDIKGAIRIRILKNRQHNCQNKKYKRTNNDLQNTHTHETKDRTTRTPSKNRKRTQLLWKGKQFLLH